MKEHSGPYHKHIHTKLKCLRCGVCCDKLLCKEGSYYLGRGYINSPGPCPLQCLDNGKAVCTLFLEIPEMGPALRIGTGCGKRSGLINIEY